MCLAFTVLLGALLGIGMYTFVLLPTEASDVLPIQQLQSEAERNFQDLIYRRTRSLDSTVKAYTARRATSPPPGFAAWYNLAVQMDAVLVEDFWDPIYEDLAAYQTMSSAALKSGLRAIISSGTGLVDTFFVRGGNVSGHCEADDIPCQDMRDMIRQAVWYLPKLTLTLPVNSHASPRIISSRSPGKTLPFTANSQQRVSTSFRNLFREAKDRVTLAIRACPSTSAVGNMVWAQETGSNDVATAITHNLSWAMEGTSLIRDLPSSRNVCEQPCLLSMHGALVAPNCLDTSTDKLAIFAPCRIDGIETALLLPSEIYWAEDPDYHVTATHTQRVPWLQRSNKFVWRGSNTGGAHGPFNWHQFHRHRFIALTNATYLSSVLSNNTHNWVGVPHSQLVGMLQCAEYLDTGFSARGCRDDGFTSVNEPCSYLDEHFTTIPWQSLDEMLASYRYFFDIDGNSYSGRFRALLMNDAVVIKATIFREWHDARLVPWVHFVPMTNHFGDDLIDIVQFFANHEDVGERIAHNAGNWSRRVLRREDMVLYILRLLLEWSRKLEVSLRS